MDALKMLPMVGRLRDLMPKTVKDAPCQEIVDETARSTSCRSSSAGRTMAARTSRCRWCSRRIPRPGCATSAPTACRSTTAARPACTGSGTRAARSTTASPSGWASGCEVAVALSAEPVLPYCATAPMPEGLDELLLGGFLSRKRDRAGEVRHRRSRGAGQLAHRARRLRRAGRAAARGAVRRSHRPLFAARRLSGVPHHLHHAAQEADLPDDGRRRAADGGFLSRPGERADLPADDPEDAARNRRTCIFRPRGSSTTSCSSRSTSAIRDTRARS